jgi:hypothetical protein
VARTTLPVAVLAILLVPVCLNAAASLEPLVEVEEVVYRYDPADNGAGPMWCGGSTCLVRVGDRVFASGLETLAEHKPLNNCRWLLFERTGGGWERQQADPHGRTREPCPMATFHDGRMFLSANPTLTAPDQYNGPARPEILQWDSARPKDPFRTLLPEWDGQPPFSEHSYRSLAADGERGELILFQNVGYAHAEWAFLDADRQWSARGKLVFPWGEDYEKPQPIRICYPNVQLQDRAVYFCGVSDIIEPNPQWRKTKKQLTGRDWDYDFRRLFFTWTEDIAKAPFRDWIEIASREATAGWIFPCDLWAAPDGTVHLLWSERALDTRLRAAFFPDAKQSQALNYATVRVAGPGPKAGLFPDVHDPKPVPVSDQKAGLFPDIRDPEPVPVSKRTLGLAEEGGADLIASAGRFHVTPDGRLLVVYYVSGTDDAGQPVSENQLIELRADGTVSSPIRIPLGQPFTSFFTATVRGGSAPSEYLDLLGARRGERNTISYARVRLIETIGEP